MVARRQIGRIGEATASVWSTWEGDGVAGGRAMGCFVHGSCGGDGGGCSNALGRSAAAQYELLFATKVTVVCIDLLNTFEYKISPLPTRSLRLPI